MSQLPAKSILSLNSILNVSDKSNIKGLGVVELMVLVCCDKAIKAKLKWLSAQALFAATTRRLALKRTKEKAVVLETEDGTETVLVMEDSAFEKDFVPLEKDIEKKSAVLSQVLQKYGILDKLPFKVDLPLRWESVSFTKIRKLILEIVAKQKLSVNPISRQNSSESFVNPVNMIGSLANWKKSSSASHLDRRPKQRIGLHDEAKKALKHNQSNQKRFHSQSFLPSNFDESPMNEAMPAQDSKIPIEDLLNEEADLTKVQKGREIRDTFFAKEDDRKIKRSYSATR